MNIKQGDILVKGEDKRKVLGIAGEAIFISQSNDYKIADMNAYTEHELTELGWKVLESPWEPKEGEKYWFPGFDGAWSTTWMDYSSDHARRDAFGIYKTEEEAQAMHDKIVEFVKSQRV